MNNLVNKKALIRKLDAKDIGRAPRTKQSS